MLLHVPPKVEVGKTADSALWIDRMQNRTWENKSRLALQRATISDSIEYVTRRSVVMEELGRLGRSKHLR